MTQRRATGITPRTRSRGLLWLAPALVFVGIFIYYPAVDNIVMSFFKWSAFTPRTFVGWDNYIQAWHDPVFWTALRNNIAYAVVSVIVQVGGGTALAALIEEFLGSRLRSVFRSIYFIPATISITVAGMLFTFMYDPKIGFIDQALEAIGLGHFAQAWLGEPETAIWAVIGMSQWQSLGYVTLLMTVAIQRIPRELYEAATIDGATRIRSFFTITVPLVRQMSGLMVIVTIAGAFLVFNEIEVMTDGGPNNASQVLGTWLYQSAFRNNDMGYGSTVATILFILTAIVGIAQMTYTKRRSVEM